MHGVNSGSIGPLAQPTERAPFGVHLTAGVHNARLWTEGAGSMHGAGNQCAGSCTVTAELANFKDSASARLSRAHNLTGRIE